MEINIKAFKRNQNFPTSWKKMRAVPFCFAICLASLISISGTTGVQAQSVTVFGNSDAQECYNDARFATSVSASSYNICTQALQLGNLTPRDRAATFVNRGIVLMHLKRFDEAYDDFDSALRIDENLGEAYLNRGNMYIYKQLYETAIEDFDKAISLGTRQEHVAHYNRGLANEALKRYDAAYQDFQKALELSPEWPLAQQRIDFYDELLEQARKEKALN